MDELSPEFVRALAAFLARLKAANGGYAKVQIEIVAGRIRRFEGVYDAPLGETIARISEPYLLTIEEREARP